MTETGPAPRPPAGPALRSLLRADATVLARNVQSLWLTFLLPVVILVVFFAGAGKRGDVAPGYVVGLAITYGLMASAMLGYPLAVARDREAGVFQRLRVTPAPTWTIPASRLAVQLALCLVMSLVVMAVGGIWRHLSYGPGAWLGVLAVSVLGAAVFLAIGQAIVGLAVTSGAVSAAGRALFALLLVVGLVGSFGVLGDALRAVSRWTPVGALANLYAAVTGVAPWGSDQWVGVVACLLYVVAGGYVGIRWFRWTVR